MEELKLIVASNLIRLRAAAGLTQAELGEKINYSDKSVSKWERGESLPDAAVLKKLAEIFQVSVDDLLTEASQWRPQKEETGLSYSPFMITLMSLFGIWTLALLVFVIFWILGDYIWMIFGAAVPVSLITLLVMNSIWNKGRKNRLIIGILILTVIALIYFCLWRYHPWQLFLVALPAELMVFFSGRVKKSRNKKNIEKTAAKS